ncbi:hypothetical protein KDW78_21945 [Burkholderia cenocepacia]|uniref:hypothetical protein n=1 Tax=Burkholderia cenocepacia TaxID=95486 RepID=UPI00158E6DA1|nr:hypothetical protein [Burkholderia cenocepacia]MBR7956541.1 hypothetical protein [Burkholderia cenocepacia]
MRHIGFDGGHSIYELGPSSDVILFFECLKTYVQQVHPDQDWSLLTDRLYRRYLRREELDKAAALMEQVRQIFTQHPAAEAVEWDALLSSDSGRSWLNPNQPTLADVFSKYFESFEKACRSAKSFVDAFNIYQPVRVVISDLPGFARDKNKPLAEYDALEGAPFWLQ